MFFWHIVASNENKLSGKLYKLLLHLSEHDNFNFKWMSYIKSIFDDCGYSEIWNIQEMSILTLYL